MTKGAIVIYYTLHTELVLFKDEPPSCSYFGNY